MMMSNKEAIEVLDVTVNLIEDNARDKTLQEAYNTIKQSLTKLEKIEKIINRKPSNGYFESVRDCIDRYNEIKQLVGEDDE